MAGTLTQAEKTRLELIITIQGLHNSGKSINDIARITGKDWKTIKKYLDGDPEQLVKAANAVLWTYTLVSSLTASRMDRPQWK